MHFVFVLLTLLSCRFSCILIAYIIGGILINKYAKHVDGKEAFPNYSFWADFPYLIKVCFYKCPASVRPPPSLDINNWKILN